MSSWFRIEGQKRPNNKAFCKICEQKIRKGDPTIAVTPYAARTSYFHAPCMLTKVQNAISQHGNQSGPPVSRPGVRRISAGS